MEMFHNIVNDNSFKMLGGEPYISTPYEYYIPLIIWPKFSYINLRSYTNQEQDSPTHIIITGDTLWENVLLNNNIIHLDTVIDKSTNTSLCNTRHR